MNRMEVMIWARRICAARNAEAHVMLDISSEATIEQAQAAFHTIARVAHPDLHRTTASAEEHELVTTAFSLVAAAYQQFRATRMATTRMAPLRVGTTQPLPDRTHRPSQTPLKLTTNANDVNPAAKIAPDAPVLLPEKPNTNVAPQMSPRALTFYRKAEQALRRGDLPAAALHLKMAIASDPQSAFLRNAIKEVESERAKKA